jgi:hypothetical protein
LAELCLIFFLINENGKSFALFKKKMKIREKAKAAAATYTTYPLSTILPNSRIGVRSISIRPASCTALESRRIINTPKTHGNIQLDQDAT